VEAEVALPQASEELERPARTAKIIAVMWIMSPSVLSS
jgi:hypothetical protein